MHVVALGYPNNASDDVKAVYKQFYTSLKTVIPCAVCAAGYRAIVEKHPVDDALGSNADLFNWTVTVHNKVSEKLNKLPMTPEFVKHVYMFGGGGDDPVPVDPVVLDTNWTIASVYGAALLVIALVAFLLYLFFRSQPNAPQ